MAVRPILVIPDQRLRSVADPIAEVDEEIRILAKDMLDTMYDVAGEGEKPDPMVLINPEITRFGEEVQVTEEGCLSIPELYYEVERPSAVTVKYTDLDGKEVVKDADGKLAVCIQHELDHLDGVLYVDYLSRLKRDRVLKKFEKAARRAG